MSNPLDSNGIAGRIAVVVIVFGIFAGRYISNKMHFLYTNRRYSKK